MTTCKCWAAVLIAVLLLPNVAASADAAKEAIRPYVTLTGTDSHVKERSYHRVTSEDEWIKIWQRHKGEKESKDYDLFYNPLGLPYIDFEKCMVIAVFQGSGWNSAGLKAVAILEEKDRIVLRFQNKSYQTAVDGPGDGGEQVTVYGFFVLPRSSKTVVLEENVQNYIGQPPVWKELAADGEMTREPALRPAYSGIWSEGELCPETRDRNATCTPSTTREWSCAILATRRPPIGLKWKASPPMIAMR